MAKFRKKLIFVVILALCLATCLTLVACNPDPPAMADYSVTVKIGDAPQSGVKVELSKDGAKVEQTTGTDGKASFELEKGTYTVTLSNLPEHYVVPATATLTLTAENPDATIVLEEEFAYVVNLVKEDSTAFTQNGVSVMACDVATNVCGTPVNIDANGVAYLYGCSAQGLYHVKVVGLNGYGYDCDANDYYTGADLSANTEHADAVTELTITLYPVTEIDFSGDAMTNPDKVEYDIDPDVTAYKFTTEVKAGGYVIYALTLNAGQYDVYNNGTEDLIFNCSSNGLKKSSAPKLTEQLTPATQTKHYIVIINHGEDDETAELVITIPSTSYITTDENVVNVTNTVIVSKATEFATIKFLPAKAGKYTITATGDAKTFIGYLVTTSDYYLRNNVMIDLDEQTYVTDNSVSLKITEDQNMTFFVGIAIQSDIYPASVEVNIKLDQEIHNVTTAAEVQETLVQQTIPNGKDIAKLPMTQEVLAALTYSDTDKCYYYGESKVYVVITEPLAALDDAALAYFDDNGYVEDYLLLNVTTSADKADLTKGNTYVDYSLFLRGFTAYDESYEGWRYVIKIPEELDEENCYANYVNDDGAYPLTTELEAFLKAFYEAKLPADPSEWSIINTDDAEDGCEWMFALYYYVDEAPADAIVGTYRFQSVKNSDENFEVGGTKSSWVQNDEGQWVEEEVPVVGNEYQLVVTKKGKFMINEADPGADGEYQPYMNGVWTKDDQGAYTFTENAEWYPAEFSIVVFNSETGYLKLYSPDPYGDSNYDILWEFYLITEEA